VPDPADAAPLKHTPLYDLHRSLGARMVGFAGYEMPVQYPAGIIAEHLHTRAKAGLFDVSHMGQITLHGASAARALEALVRGDLQGLMPRRMRYTLLLNAAGGILDDLIASRVDDGVTLVVNAARKEADLAHLLANLDSAVAIEPRFERAPLGAARAASRRRPGALCRRPRPSRVHERGRRDDRRRAVRGDPFRLYRRGRVRIVDGPPRIAARVAEALLRERRWRRSASARATRCASRRGSASTAMISTRPRPRLRPASPGP